MAAATARSKTTRKSSPRATVLSNVPIFSGLTKKELASIQRLMSSIPIKAGNEFIKEGAIGREAFVIVSGDASVWKGGKLVASVGPGSVLGEMALLAGTPRDATVKAETDLMVEVLNAGEFAAFLDANGSLTRKVLKATIARLLQAEPSLTS